MTALFVFCASACGGSPTLPSLAGEWGGDHVSLTVTEQAAYVELDCAHGDLSETLRAGSFSVPGTYVREHGGPIRTDEKPDSHPALFSGTVSGNHMSLAIRLTDTNESVGTFTLTRGSTGQVVKCL